MFYDGLVRSFHFSYEGISLLQYYEEAVLGQSAEFCLICSYCWFCSAKSVIVERIAQVITSLINK